MHYVQVSVYTVLQVEYFATFTLYFKVKVFSVSSVLGAGLLSRSSALVLYCMVWK